MVDENPHLSLQKSQCLKINRKFSFLIGKRRCRYFFKKTQSESEIEIIQLYSLGIEMKDFREIVILSAPNFINHEFLGTSLIIPSQEALILDFSIF